MFDYEREKQARSAASVADSLLHHEKSAMRKLLSSFCNLMIFLFVCVRFFIGSPNRHYSFSFDQVPETTFLLLFQFWAFKLLCLQTSMTCSLGPIFNLQNMSLFEFLARDTKDMIIFQFPPNDSH